MKQILEDLWYSYEMENSMEQTKEFRKILEKLCETEMQLKDNFNAQQKELFSSYEACMNEVCSFSERDAFIKGVRFTARFLLAALE